MTLEQVYAAIGGDYKGVMERLPSADFVRRFALKFLQDDSFPNLKKALEALDGVSAAEVSHTAGTAVVTLDKPVDDTVLKKAVEDKDYTVTGIE